MTLGSLADPAAGHPEWIWRNGGLVPWETATVHVNAVGHASVAAVFEGVKAYLAADGSGLFVFRLDEHIERLFASARICRLGVPFTPAELREAALTLLRANGFRADTYLRPWVFPAGTIREQMVPENAPCEVVIDSWPFTGRPPGADGCRAAVSSWLRIGDASTPPRAKAFSNYHNGRLAMMEARTNGHDWPILLNERHKVAEGPGSCLALVRGGTVVTPPLTSGVLDGITRSSVLDLLADLGVPTEVREVDRSELYLADELFFMGTAWEILPIAVIDGLPVGAGRPGPVTARLAKTYDALVRGGYDGRREWLTELPF